MTQAKRGTFRALRLASFFVMLVCLPSAYCQTVAPLGVRVVGIGSHPLSFTEASAWFASKADDSQKVITVLFYFQGNPGWLSGSTDFKYQINQNPASIDMKVGDVPISAKYWQQTDEVELQGQKFKRSHDNVFLVSAIDTATATVKPLGLHDLSFAPDDIPSITLLRRDPQVWSAVSGNPVEDHPRTKLASTPSEILSWDSEGLKLLLSANQKDEQKGCELFRKSAERGYAPSQYRLGYCYQTGRGVKQSFSVANQWYEKAANQGYVDAQYKLGYSYQTGRGVKIDMPIAMSWYKKAAQSGDGDALHNVGMMYATGLGTATDQAEAYRWFVKAAQSGDTGAQFEVAQRLKDGIGIGKDLSLAYSWLLVLNAQKENFSASDWNQVQALITSVSKQLDTTATNRAIEQSKLWMRIISAAQMQSYSHQ